MTTEETYRSALQLLHPDSDDVIEIRTVGRPALSMYSRDRDAIVKTVAADDTQTWYIVMNAINPACYSRSQCERMTASGFSQETKRYPTDAKLSATSDAEITRIHWILIDFDPVRPSGVSSTDAEKAAAYDSMMQAYDCLCCQCGFSEPVIADSGNGYHLLFKVNLPPDCGAKDSGLVHRFLKVMSKLFETAAVDVDTAVFNPSRITKLYGTLSSKGADTAERPHRRSGFVYTPETVTETAAEIIEYFIEQNAEPIPEQPAKIVRSRSTGRSFDLIDFMRSHDIRYTESRSTGRDNSIIFALDACPFDSSHRNGDAKIFQFPNGAIAFKCHHNSCSGYHWQDVRELFEPGCYDSQPAFIEPKKDLPRKARKAAPEPEPQAIDYSNIIARRASDIDFRQIERPIQYVDGMLTDGVYTLCAFSKTGKSRLLLQMLLAICQGRPFLSRSTLQCDCLYLAFEDMDKDYRPRLQGFLLGAKAPENLYTLTKQDFPNYETPRLEGGLEELIESHIQRAPGTKVVGIDVLSIIRSERRCKDFTDDERRDILTLQRIAAKHNLAIVIAHHVSKGGLKELSKSKTSIGAGAGSFTVSGTVTGEFSLYRDPDDRTHAVFKAEGRRTRESAIYLRDAFPRWEYEAELSAKVAADIEARNDEQYHAIMETVKYLVDRDNGWCGTATQFQQENETNHALPALGKRIDRNSFTPIQDRLKASGIVYTLRENGSGAPRHSFTRISTAVDTDIQLSL